MKGGKQAAEERVSALSAALSALKSRRYACHFEPKARNLGFPSPPVLRELGWRLQNPPIASALEPVHRACWLCSPPISVFPPIREKGGYLANFSKKSLPKETASKLAGLPSPKLGEGRGVGAWRAGDTTVIPSRRRDKQLSFRAEGEKSWVSIPTSSEGVGVEAAEPANCFGSRASSPSKPTLLAPYPSFRLADSNAAVLADGTAAAREMGFEGNGSGRW